MSWFRRYRRQLLQLALGVWVLAVLVTAVQGCLVQPDHSPTAPHETLSTLQLEEGHALHASGFLRHCDDAAQAVSRTAPLPAADLASLAILLLLPAVLLFNPAEKIAFAASASRRPALAAPPARLIFVRFND